MLLSFCEDIKIRNINMITIRDRMDKDFLRDYIMYARSAGTLPVAVLLAMIFNYARVYMSWTYCTIYDKIFSCAYVILHYSSCFIHVVLRNSGARDIGRSCGCLSAGGEISRYIASCRIIYLTF